MLVQLHILRVGGPLGEVVHDVDCMRLGRKELFFDIFHAPAMDMTRVVSGAWGTLPPQI